MKSFIITYSMNRKKNDKNFCELSYNYENSISAKISDVVQGWGIYFHLPFFSKSILCNSFDLIIQLAENSLPQNLDEIVLLDKNGNDVIFRKVQVDDITDKDEYFASKCYRVLTPIVFDKLDQNYEKFTHPEKFKQIMRKYEFITNNLSIKSMKYKDMNVWGYTCVLYNTANTKLKSLFIGNYNNLGFGCILPYNKNLR